jgi:hypothetical protein
MAALGFAIDHWQVEPFRHEMLDSITAMRSLLIAMLFACGGSPPPPTLAPPPPPPPADAAAPTTDAWFTEAIVKMNTYADQMCACKDVNCAKKVSDDMTAWGEQQAKEHPDPPQLNDEQTKSASAVGQRMGECMQKLVK